MPPRTTNTRNKREQKKELEKKVVDYVLGEKIYSTNATLKNRRCVKPRSRHPPASQNARNAQQTETAQRIEGNQRGTCVQLPNGKVVNLLSKTGQGRQLIRTIIRGINDGVYEIMEEIITPKTVKIQLEPEFLNFVRHVANNLTVELGGGIFINPTSRGGNQGGEPYQFTYVVELGKEECIQCTNCLTYEAGLITFHTHPFKEEGHLEQPSFCDIYGFWLRNRTNAFGGNLYELVFAPEGCYLLMYSQPAPKTQAQTKATKPNLKTAKATISKLIEEGDQHKENYAKLQKLLKKYGITLDFFSWTTITKKGLKLTIPKNYMDYQHRNRLGALEMAKH